MAQRGVNNAQGERVNKRKKGKVEQMGDEREDRKERKFKKRQDIKD
jgi:hypothetical protein